jgi:2'-5' RNA ligase
MSKLFLAFDIPDHARHQISEFIPKVSERLDRQGMRWLSTNRFGVRITEFSEIEEADVLELLNPALNEVSEQKFTLTHVDGLPDRKRPGHLVIKCESSDDIQLRKALEGLTEAEDEAMWEPVIVISQMKPASTKLGHKLRDFIHSGARPEEISFTSETISLYELAHDGSTRTIHQWMLKRR